MSPTKQAARATSASPVTFDRNDTVFRLEAANATLSQIKKKVESRLADRRKRNHILANRIMELRRTESYIAGIQAIELRLEMLGRELEKESRELEEKVAKEVKAREIGKKSQKRKPQRRK